MQRIKSEIYLCPIKIKNVFQSFISMDGSSDSVSCLQSVESACPTASSQVRGSRERINNP